MKIRRVKIQTNKKRLWRLGLLLWLRKQTINFTPLKRRSGFSTLMTMLVVMALLIGLLLSIRLMTSLSDRSGVFRREQVLSRNILLSHNRFFFSHYGLLTYSGQMLDFDGLVKRQFEEQKYKTLRHRLVALGRLTERSELLGQVKETVSVKMAESVLLEQEQLQKFIEVLGPGMQAFSKLSQVEGNLESLAGVNSGPRGKIPPSRGQTGGTRIQVRAKAKGTPVKTQLSDAGGSGMGDEDEESALLKSFRKKMLRLGSLAKENGMNLDGNVAEDAAEDQIKLHPVPITLDTQPKLEDKVWIMAYASGVFSDRVVSKKREWAFYDKSERPSPVPSGEMEYLLVGTRNNRWNQRVVAGEIFALRSTVQTAAVLLDKGLMAQIQEEATALYAIMPAVPQPVFAASLVALEAAERATRDLGKLLNGEGVMFYPQQQGLGKSFDTVYYDDYLRMLILTKSEEVLMERMLGMITASYEMKMDVTVDLSTWTTRHRLAAIHDGRVLTQVDDGYLRENEEKP